jgi:hypothetical protein
MVYIAPVVQTPRDVYTVTAPAPKPVVTQTVASSDCEAEGETFPEGHTFIYRMPRNIYPPKP